MQGDRAPSQLSVISADGRREFACFPAAILAFIVNADDEFLLLSHPARKGGWEIVSGALKEGESPVEALLREVSEEAGPDVRIRPVASVHTFLYRFDAAIQAMFSIGYVATYLSGEVVPGSDMAMSAYRWASLREIESARVAPTPGMHMEPMRSVRMPGMRYGHGSRPHRRYSGTP